MTFVRKVKEKNNVVVITSTLINVSSTMLYPLIPEPKPCQTIHYVFSLIICTNSEQLTSLVYNCLFVIHQYRVVLLIIDPAIYTRPRQSTEKYTRKVRMFMFSVTCVFFKWIFYLFRVRQTRHDMLYTDLRKTNTLNLYNNSSIIHCCSFRVYMFIKCRLSTCLRSL